MEGSVKRGSTVLRDLPSLEQPTWNESHFEIGYNSSKMTLSVKAFSTATVIEATQ